MNYEDTTSGDTRSDCAPCSGSGICDMCEGTNARFSHYDNNGDPVFDYDEPCLHCYENKPGKCGYCLGTGKFEPAFYNSTPAEQRLEELRNIRSYEEPEHSFYDHETL